MTLGAHDETPEHRFARMRAWIVSNIVPEPPSLGRNEAMSAKDVGGYAFPLQAASAHNGQYGMTLRDWFAGQALEGMNASPALLEAVTAKVAGEGSHYERLARHAYLQADAMLQERSK